MKKIIIICVILILCGCGNVIKFENQENCNKAKLLLNLEEKNIYTYCIENTKIKVDNKEIELEKFIKDDNNAIDKIIKELKHTDTLKDGGTRIYKGNITLIKCNTLDGNKDIYIGNKNMEFKENFCKDNNYTFIRTYTVNKVSEYTKQQYTDDGILVSYGNSFEVSLSEYNGNTKTVIINNLWGTTLKKNKTYEFEFMLYEDAKDIKDDIEYIFKNSTIVSVKETEKLGLDQIQEPIKQLE